MGEGTLPAAGDGQPRLDSLDRPLAAGPGKKAWCHRDSPAAAAAAPLCGAVFAPQRQRRIDKGALQARVGSVQGELAHTSREEE